MEADIGPPTQSPQFSGQSTQFFGGCADSMRTKRLLSGGQPRPWRHLPSPAPCGPHSILPSQESSRSYSGISRGPWPVCTIAVTLFISLTLDLIFNVGSLSTRQKPSRAMWWFPEPPPFPWSCAQVHRPHYHSSCPLIPFTPH